MFLALAGEPRAEDATRVPPAGAGQDSAPDQRDGETAAAHPPMVDHWEDDQTATRAGLLPSWRAVLLGGRQAAAS